MAETYSTLVRGTVVRRFRELRLALRSASTELPYSAAAEWLQAMGTTNSIRTIVDSSFERLEANPSALYMENPGQPVKRTRFLVPNDDLPQGNAEKDCVNTHFAIIKAMRKVFNDNQNKGRNASRLSLFKSVI